MHLVRLCHKNEARRVGKGGPKIGLRRGLCSAVPTRSAVPRGHGGTHSVPKTVTSRPPLPTLRVL